MAAQVKLVGFWASPFAFRVEWALKLKGVEFEYIEEDIFNKSNRLLELNPVHKKVPVLVHDQKIIAESFVILEYIDETWTQNPLLPQDPHKRAMARFWTKFAEEKLLEPAWTSMWYKGEEKERAEKLAMEALEKIEEQLKGNKYFGGDDHDTIGYLDIAIGWISYWLPVWEEVGSMKILDPEKFPSITAWKIRLLDHPKIRDSLPPRDKLLEYFHKRSQVLYSYYGSQFSSMN
ncbi:hypothetical protein ACOSP7_006754 [Xanthoceras sorbifolium]|uniref:glutathione transferase n=1 Tax=Xanthoceras sorbifolium TaxID=99658 RepID=A0ABQ8I9A3_9ROSI|nr:hypothetical protein JRO89_XS03G0094700 [Xanthoceras sorbifolium]